MCREWDKLPDNAIHKATDRARIYEQTPRHARTCASTDPVGSFFEENWDGSLEEGQVSTDGALLASLFRLHRRTQSHLFLSCVPHGGTTRDCAPVCVCVAKKVNLVNGYMRRLLVSSTAGSAFNASYKRSVDLLLSDQVKVQLEVNSHFQALLLHKRL